MSPLRSVLFVPAANRRALEKSGTLAADALIFDLEDSAGPQEKDASRERLRAHLAGLPAGRGGVVRINPLGSAFGTEDLAMALGAWSRAADGPAVSAILVPKVERPEELRQVADALAKSDAPEALRLWAMIETPKGILNAASIAETGAAMRLEALVVGPNDIAAATGIRLSPGRPELLPWLAQIVLAAKAQGLAVIDGVYNDFGDDEGFAAECAAARAMGFDGKTLIHPRQIAAANLAFAPTASDMEEARAILAAFALPENAGKGVVQMKGRMVERLHLAKAEAMLALYGKTA